MLLIILTVQTEQSVALIVVAGIEVLAQVYSIGVGLCEQSAAEIER